MRRLQSKNSIFISIHVNQFQKAGSYEAVFQPALSNKQLASGMYVYQLTSVNLSSSSQNGQAGQDYVESKKMLMLK